MGYTRSINDGRFLDLFQNLAPVIAVGDPGHCSWRVPEENVWEWISAGSPHHEDYLIPDRQSVPVDYQILGLE